MANDVTIQQNIYTAFVGTSWTTLYTTPDLNSMYKFYFLFHNNNSTTERIRIKFVIDSVDLVWWNDDLVSQDTLAINYPQEHGLILPQNSTVNAKVDTADQVTLIMTVIRTSV